MDYRDALWMPVVPTPDTLKSDWGRTVVAEVKPLDPRLTAVADAFRAMLDGEQNVQLAQFSIEAAPAIAWVLCTNRWLEFAMLDRLFSHPVIKGALPALQGTEANVGSFACHGPFEGLGRLADRVIEGGPYTAFPGSNDEAFLLALNFMSAVCDRRFSEIMTFSTRDAWTNWFFAVGPDSSFVWFDKRSGIATVLLLTGTD